MIKDREHEQNGGLTSRGSGENDLLDSSKRTVIEERSADLGRSRKASLGGQLDQGWPLPLTLPNVGGITFSEIDALSWGYRRRDTAPVLAHGMDAPIFSTGNVSYGPQ